MFSILFKTSLFYPKHEHTTHSVEYWEAGLRTSVSCSPQFYPHLIGVLNKFSNCNNSSLKAVANPYSIVLS